MTEQRMPDNNVFLKIIAMDLSGKGLGLTSAVSHGRGVITVELDTNICRTFYLRAYWKIRRSRRNKRLDRTSGFGYFDHNYPHEGVTDIHRRIKERLTSLNGVRIKNKPTFLQ